MPSRHSRRNLLCEQADIRRFSSGAATVAVLVMTSACGTNAEEQAVPPPTTSQPPEILYTNVWSADPDVDLLQRGPELVRATYESADYTRFVGQARSFPGYPEAVGGPTRRSNADKEDFFTSAEPGEDEQIALTNFLHITGYAETATGIGATVCSYNLHADPGVNLSVEGLNLAYRIELERIGEDGLPGIPDTDPARHDPRANRLPLWNVFDGWKITKLRYLRPTKGDEMPQGCIDWWLRQLPGFTQNASAVVVPPPGFEPPTMPVAVQYPEWIGPATPE
jgi:hypothetical protein